MIVKKDNAGTWFCCESSSELMLLMMIFSSFGELSNEIINKHIKELIDNGKYDEIGFIIDGIDAESARELALDIIEKV